MTDQQQEGSRVDGRGSSGTPEPYKGYAEEVGKLRVRQAEAAEASGAVLPGPLAKVFAGAEPEALPHGLRLQPVTAGLLTVLVRIESPLLEVVKAYSLGKSAEEIAQRLADLNPPPEAMVETVFCFVTPAPKLRALLAQGRPAFREAAAQAIGDTLHPAELAQMEVVIGRHYAESFITYVRYEACPEEGGGAQTVFSEPPAGKMTGSAGG